SRSQVCRFPTVPRPASIDRWTWRKEAWCKVSASMAEWSARLTTRRLNMNAYVTTGIRDLTAQELDQVTGGLRANDEQLEGLVWASIGAVIGLGIAGFFDWLFG